MKTLLKTVCALGPMALVLAPEARAGLILTFDQGVYQAGLPGSVAVSVYVAQTAGGPQVGPGNALLTGAILVTFDSPTGVAAVESSSDITPGPAWDASSAGVTPTTASLALTSVLGIADLSSPVLLGTFVFTGLAKGQTMITAAQLDPGSADFITSLGDVLDPIGTATARLLVGAAIPEPSSFVLGLLAMILLGVRLRLCPVSTART